MMAMEACQQARDVGATCLTGPTMAQQSSGDLNTFLVVWLSGCLVVVVFVVVVIVVVVAVALGLR